MIRVQDVVLKDNLPVRQAEGVRAARAGGRSARCLRSEVALGQRLWSGERSRPQSGMSARLGLGTPDHVTVWRGTGWAQGEVVTPPHPHGAHGWQDLHGLRPRAVKVAPAAANPVVEAPWGSACQG